MVIGKETVVAFGAHPDDLEIGMGGTIAKLSASGYDVKLIIATLPNFIETDKKEERRAEAIESAKLMGCCSPTFLDLDPDQMIHGRKLVTLIDNTIKQHHPTAVFTQWIGDSHQDHQALTKAVISACRDHKDLFMYETTIPGGVTEQAFRPQLFIDVSNTSDVKVNALQCFDSQRIRCGPIWIDAIIGRARYRGYQNNTKYAEAFEVIKVSKW
jgi:LmbE family N-acetylglucosaminyl deacetylase